MLAQAVVLRPDTRTIWSFRIFSGGLVAPARTHRPPCGPRLRGFAAAVFRHSRRFVRLRIFRRLGRQACTARKEHCKKQKANRTKHGKLHWKQSVMGKPLHFRSLPLFYSARGKRLLALVLKLPDDHWWNGRWRLPATGAAQRFRVVGQFEIFFSRNPAFANTSLAAALSECGDLSPL